jgi:hypothetical protein
MSQTFTITFKAPTTGLSDHDWFFCLQDKQAFLFKTFGDEDDRLHLIERADVLEAGDKLYIKYSGEKAYEIAGPKSQKKYQLWLAEKILEQEVFDED